MKSLPASPNEPANTFLFLFDIDGTLLRGMPPAHRYALCAAANAVYGVALTADEMGHTAGMTDTAIVRRALLHVGLPDDVIARGLPACFALAADHYARLVPADLRPYHTPHAAATLAWLRERGAALGLVTGNVARIAAIKLAAAGLADFFPTAPATSSAYDAVDVVGMANQASANQASANQASANQASANQASANQASANQASANQAPVGAVTGAPTSSAPTHRMLFGGFGDEAEAREALPPLALARAPLVFGKPFAAAHVYVIGDTPADIACGAAHGLRTVGVATGLHALADLRACQPDYTLTDLSELRGLVWA